MYVILENNFDYENINFKVNKEEAIKCFNDAKDEFNKQTTQSITLFEVAGDGSIYFGDNIVAEDNVNIIHHHNEYESY